MGFTSLIGVKIKGTGTSVVCSNNLVPQINNNYRVSDIIDNVILISVMKMRASHER